MSQDNDDEIQLITTDHNLTAETSVISENDAALLDQVETGEGLVTVTPEQLREFAEQAQQVHQLFIDHIRKFMTEKFARKVLELRESHSLRALAEAMYADFGEYWGPPDNQIAGVALEEVAQEVLGCAPTEEEKMAKARKALIDAGLLKEEDLPE